MDAGAESVFLREEASGKTHVVCFLEEKRARKPHGVCFLEGKRVRKHTPEANRYVPERKLGVGAEK